MAKVTPRLIKIITDAAHKYDLPVDYMITMAYIESGFNPSAYNEGSKAAGLYQFIPSTQKFMKVKDPFDPEQAADGAARLTKDNIRVLKNSNIPTDPPYLYLAHQQGAGGAIAIVRSATLGTPVTASLRRNMDCNGGLNKTPKEFLDFWLKTYQAKHAMAIKLQA